jgi:hypothetical protein
MFFPFPLHCCQAKLWALWKHVRNLFCSKNLLEENFFKTSKWFFLFNSNICLFKYFMCHDLSLGLVTKARAWKGAGWNATRESRSHFWECGKMWGNKPTHSQVDSHFGSSSLDGLPIIQRVVWKIKIHWIEDSLYHWKALLTPTKFNIRRKMVFFPKSVICQSMLTHALFVHQFGPNLH